MTVRRTSLSSSRTFPSLLVSSNERRGVILKNCRYGKPRNPPTLRYGESALEATMFATLRYALFALSLGSLNCGGGCNNPPNPDRFPTESPTEAGGGVSPTPAPTSAPTDEPATLAPTPEQTPSPVPPTPTFPELTPTQTPIPEPTDTPPAADTDGPVIEHTQEIFSLEEGDEVTLWATITDESMIDTYNGPLLGFYNEGVSPQNYSVYTMNNPEGNEWRVTISGELIDQGQLNYFFWAQDIWGNESILPLGAPFNAFEIEVVATTPTPIPPEPTPTPEEPVTPTPEQPTAEPTEEPATPTLPEPTPTVLPPTATPVPPPTLPEDGDGDEWKESDGDCDDANVTVYPGAMEVCDGLDNDCDGRVDREDGTFQLVLQDVPSDVRVCLDSQGQEGWEVWGLGDVPPLCTTINVSVCRWDASDPAPAATNDCGVHGWLETDNRLTSSDAGGWAYVTFGAYTGDSLGSDCYGWGLYWAP